jgi:hypothetical protein
MKPKGAQANIIKPFIGGSWLKSQKIAYTSYLYIYIHSWEKNKNKKEKNKEK